MPGDHHSVLFLPAQAYETQIFACVVVVVEDAMANCTLPAYGYIVLAKGRKKKLSIWGRVMYQEEALERI